MTGKWMGKRVVVIMGGVSKERDISLRTGAAITEALKKRGYDVMSINMSLGADFVSRLVDLKPDVALIALHGKYGEDGCVQGLLEVLRIPYTGSGVMPSSVAMDKVVTSHIARMLGIKCPAEVSFDGNKEDARVITKKICIPLPVIVKPSREGSTINISIVDNLGGLDAAIALALESDTKVIIQEYIKGKEITVGLLNGKALPVLEIAPKSGFYDYTSKYTKGMTEYIVPARIPEDMAKRVGNWSEEIARELDCEGTLRADFIVAENGDAYFLEINTIPGMTGLSLVPKAAAHIGLSFEDVCEQLLNGARLKINL